MMQPTAYPDVNRVLEQLLARLQTILAPKLVGIYLYGSLVYGDFEPRSSDIDLLTVITSPLTDEELSALAQMHLAFSAANPRWEDRIEVAYLSLDAITSFHSHRSLIANISPGEPFHTLKAGKEWLVNWYMVRAIGIALFGPQPQEVIPPIAKEEFIENVRNNALAWAEWVENFRHRGGQAYVIITMCRALYTLTYGEQISKPKAAAWASQTYPQWAALIQNALAWRVDWRDPAGEAEATYPETVRFVHFAISQIA
jgi:hypothetical protein